MKNKKSFGILLSFVLVLAGFIFGSCEIGLGAAVDTEAPSITIESPGIDVVIRDSFAIRGSWSDDGDVAEINAKLERTDGTGTPFNFPGEFVIEEETNRRSGSWKVIINPKEQGILDGTYQASISIKDKGEHVTTQTRTFTIDNTPPLIVLHRPASKVDSESVDSYGQSFTLTGQAADDNNVKLIRINFYSDPECKNFLHSVERKNVPPTIDLDVAQFKEGEENDYFRIYQSSTKEGTKQFYCSIEAYDEAQRYPIDGNQTAADTNGNFTDTYYLYEELVTEILSDYKITEVYHMQSGTYKDADVSRSADISNVIMSKLAAKEIKKGSFSLNPENNPVFTVSGKSELTGRVTDFVDSEYSITNGSSLQFEITPGLDNFPIKADTVKIYVIECDNSQHPLDGAEKIYLTTGTPTKSGSTLKYRSSLSSKTSTIVVGHNYLFGIEGEDEKNNLIVPKGKGYGFHLSSSGAAPEVIITSPEKQFYKGGEDVLVEGSVLIAEGIPLFTIYNNDEAVYTTDFSTVTPEQQGSKNKYNFSYTIPAEKFVTRNAQGAQISAKFEIKATATYEGIVGSKTSTIVYDVENPTLEITSHDVNINYNGSASFSGSSVMFSGTATDPSKTLGCSISSIKYVFKTVDQTPTDAEWKSMSSIGDWYLPANLKIDNNSPEGALEEGQYYLFMKGVDLAGNESNLVRLAFYVDQFSPEFNVSGLQETTYINTEDIPFSLSSTEENLVYSVSIEPPLINHTTGTVTPETSGTQNYKILAAELLSNQGYTLTTTAKDNSNKITTKVFTIMKDDVAPTVIISDPENDLAATEEEAQRESPFKISGTVNDGEGVGVASYSYVYSQSENAPTESSAWTIVNLTTGNWSVSKSLASGTIDTLATDGKLCEGKWYLHVKAKDKSGNESLPVKRSFYVDLSVPVLTDNTSITESANCIKQNNTYFFKDYLTVVVEGNDTYGLPENPYTITIDTDELTDVIPVKEGNKYTYSIPATKFIQDIYQTIKISVKDKVGKVGTVKSYNVFKDITAPVVDIINPVGGSSQDQTEIQAVFSAEDNGIGIKIQSSSETADSALEFSTDNTNWTKTKYTGGARFNQSITLTGGEGQKTLYVRATDKLGNVSETKSVSFYYDCADPVITSTAPSSYAKAGESFTLTGTSYDTNELSYIEVKDTTASQTYKSTDVSSRISIAGTIAEAKDESTAVTWAITFTPADNLTEGNHNFKIRAYDVAGRLSDEITESVFVDRTAPTVLTSNTPTVTQTENGSFKFEGTAKDDTNASKDSKVKEVLLQFANGTATVPAATGWVTAVGSTNWNSTITFSEYTTVFNTEGLKKVFIKAADNAGNESAVYTTTFKYDKAAPEGAITGYTPNGHTSPTGITAGSSTFSTKDEFSISGTAGDTNAVKRVEIYQIKGTSEQKLIAVKVGNITTWEVRNLPRAATESITAGETDEGLTGTAVVDSASYEYYVKVYDTVDKVTESNKITATIDNTAPVVTITAPTAVNSTTTPVNMTVENALSGSSSNFTGNADDGMGVGLASYSYVFTKNATAPTDPAAWTTVTKTSNGEWSFNKEFASGTTDVTGKLCEGQWYLYVKAKDKAENESTPVCCSFYVDLNAPILSQNTAITAGNTCIEKSSTFYFKTSLTVVVEGSDTYALAETPYTIAVNGTVLTGLDLTARNGNKYTYTIPESRFTSGDYSTLKVTVNDVAGKTASKEFNIYRDNTAPVVDITRPESGSNQDQTAIQAVFTVEENGIGVNSATTTGTGASAVTNADSDLEFSTDNANWTKTKYTGGARFNQPITLTGGEGQKTLYVRATDKLGNVSETKSVSFYYDRYDPVITSTAPSSYAKAGESFTLTGTSYDTNELSYIEVKDTTASQTYKSTDASSRISITGTIAEAKDESTAVTWAITFTAAELSEGNHNFKIRAYDVAGRFSDEITESVFVDRTAPTLNDDINLIMPNVTQTENGSFKFEGTAKDDTNASKDSKVKEVLLQFGNGTATEPSTDWITAVGTTNWNSTITFSDYTTVFNTEGSKKVFIKAVDYAGNESAIVTKTFDYDKSSPTSVITSYTPNGSSAVSITSGVTTFSTKDKFALGVTAGDTNAIKRIEVYQGTQLIAVKVGDNTSIDVPNLPRATTENITNVTVDGGLNASDTTAEVNTGSYVYKVKVYDAVNKVTDSNTITINIDKTAPTFTILTPTEGGSKGAGAINSATFKFSGNANDGEDASSTGVGKVWYQILPSTSQAPTAPTANFTVDSSWTNKGFTAANGTDSWNFFGAFKAKGTTGTEFEEGTYKVYVCAVDNAGNCAAIQSVEFDVDMKDPKVTTTWGDNSEFNSSTTQIKTGSYTIKYKVEETNGYASGSPSLTVKKDDVAIGKTTSTTTPYYTESTADANGYKTVTVVIPTNVNGDGLYEYTIYAKDVVGKETSITRNVRLDTKPPVLTVISPTLSEYQNSEKVKINGSSEDDSGTLAVWYAYAPSTAPTVPATNTTVDETWKAAGWIKANGTTNWKITGDVTNGVDSGNGDGILGVEGSAKTIYIAAVDKNGLVSTHAPETVMVDKTPPTVVTETSDMFVNKTFYLTGYVFDPNGISSVSISDGTTSYTPSLAQGSGSYANAKNYTSRATWTKSFTITEGRNGSESGELLDGNYTFTITTTDIAGKTTVNTRSIKIDTVAPVISSKTITFTDNPAVASGVAHNVNKADLTVVTSDDNLDQVYYYVKDDSDTTITSAADVEEGLWNAIIPTTSNGVTTYKKKLSFSDGTGKIYLKVTDKASNETTDITLPYAVDTKAPEVPTLVSVDGETLSGDKLVNGKNNVTFILTVKDQNNASNVASVNLSTIGSTTVTTPTTEAEGKGTKIDADNGKWKIIIPSAKFEELQTGSHAIKVKVSDLSGNTEEYQIFSVALDNTKPKSEIKIPASSTINGTLDITGTVTENNPKSVSLYYSTAETAPTASPTTTNSGWTLVTGATKTVGTGGVTTSDISNFTFSNINVNTLSGAETETNKQHVLHFLAFATDEAGNECEIGSSSTVKSVKTYTVDMDADRPVIKFNNIELGASMSSTVRTGFESRELYGSVSDDDGIKEIKYYIGDSMPAKDATSWISPADNSNFTYSSGSFTIKFLTSDGKASDGVKNIFFRVTDNADNVFLSSTSTTYDVSSIKVTDGTNNYGYRPNSGTTTNASAVYLKVDTTAPSVAESGYTKAATPDSGDTGWSQEITSSVFGGTNNKFYIRQYAYDTNGISSVVLHIPYDATDSGVSGYSNESPSTDKYYEYSFAKQNSGSVVKDTKTFNGNIYDKYVSSVINVTGMVSGTRPCEIIASDGIKTQITSVNVSIDNKAPIVRVQSQAANEQLRAGFLMKGIFEDGDQGTKLWYSLSKNTTSGTWSASKVEKTTAMEWSIYFDGDQTPQDGYTHEVVPKDIIAQVYSDIVKIETTGANTGKAVWKAAGTGHSAGDLYTPITTVYFHFKVQDSIGNENTSYIPLKLDPQGDIPIITQVSPTEEILSGIIRFTGTADDDNKIAGLYIEIDPQYNGTTFVPWSSSHITKKGKSPEDIMTSENYPNNPYEFINSRVESSKKKDTTTKAIYIGNGLSWNIALNKYAEWDPSSGNQSVAVRFYATDVDGNMSLASDVYAFQIDSESPKIGSSVPFYLKQYFNNTEGTGTVTASVEFTDGMWLKGEWWLEGSVEDESGIASVTMNSSETGLTKTAETWTSVNTSGFTVKYKVGSTVASAGKLTYKLETTDNDSTPKSASRDFIINYDNKAPTLQPSTGDDFNINENVVNDNGFYMVQSAAEEGSSESGFDRAIFYFERTTSRYEAVYDSYIAKGKTGNKVTGHTKDATDNLYWVTKTTSAISGKNVTVPNSANIHKGGLAKFGGALYKITDIYVGASDTVVTLDKTLDETLVGQTISFVIGHVVDHTGTESTGTKAGIITDKDAYGYGYYGNSPDDDGDLMIEKVQTNGTKTVWNGTINSANIPDGPIEIHYVVFDKAGNSAHGVVTGKVSNNAPRLAGVTVWTDYNGNKKGWRNSGEHAADYESETKSKYYSTVRPMIGGKTTEKSKALTNKLIVSSNDLGIGDSNGSTKGNAFMKVTDTVKVIPEIVGGNGGLYYQYSVGKQKNDGTLDVKKSGGTTESKLMLLKDDGSTQVNGVDETDDDVTEYDSNTTLNYIQGHTDGVITFTAADILSQIDNSSSEDPTWFDIIIWDSTEGGNPYETTNGTLNCEMQIALNNQYTDNTSPNTYVNNLYWNSATDNSVYIDTSNDQLKGHVELIKDIKDFDSESEMATNYGLDDDKVSGIVVFRGTAYDNKRLSEISWTLKNSSGNNIWPDGGYIKATYSNGSWSTSGALNATPYCKIDISTDAKDGAYFNGNGHKVAWTLTINTNWVKNNIGGTEYPVCKDARLTMNAKDTAGKTTSTTVNTTSTDDTVRNNPTYKMDIVPYIVDIETRLAKKDTSNPTVYSRTAKGHYPIASDEGAITLKGYNLALEDGTVTIPAATVAAMTSGAYIYPVYDPDGDDNDIMTINNMNNNDAHGDFVIEDGFTDSKKVTNMYNRQPNTTTNLKLTDDVYFDVWDLNQTSAASNGALKDPVMHINPSTKQIGFGFVNAVDAVSFPTSEYSYRIMEKNNKDYIGTNFAYDSNGNAHTISIGLDAQQHTSIAGRMNYIYSKWNSTGNTDVRNWNKTNAIALESIGIPRDIYVKGTRNSASADLIDIDRFPNPKIAVATHGTTPTVYVMYYDADHDQIRFRQGSINDSDTDNTGNYSYNNGTENQSTRRERTVTKAGARDYKQISTRNSTRNNWGNNETEYVNYGLLNDSKSERYRHGDTQNTSIPNSDGTNYDNHGMFEASKEYYAIVTGDYYNQTNYTINNGTAGQLGYSTGNKGSKYYAMDVIAGTAIGSDKVVMIWFDNSTQKLMYVYRTNITETSNMDASSAGVKNGNTTYWSVPKSVFGDTALPLQDCVIKADSKGGIHIAAYDLISADLKYAYFPSYNYLDTATNTAYTCTVDAYSQCGNCLQIDTVLDSTGNKVIPYISYLSEGMFYLPKVAFIPGGIDPTAPGNAIKDGADKDTKLFTGNWEVSLIPTTSELQKYNVCIGVWRDADGKITTPTKGTDAATGTTDRKRYANGTTNLVLGYSHKLNGIGYMETAMYKGVPSY